MVKGKATYYRTRISIMMKRKTKEEKEGASSSNTVASDAPSRESIFSEKLDYQVIVPLTLDVYGKGS